MSRSWALSILLLFALCAAFGCKRAPSPAATLPPAEPEQTQPAESTVSIPQSQGSEPVTTPTRGSSGKDTTPPASPDEPFSTTVQDAAEVAIADLAARLDIDRTEIQVIEVTRQEFPLPDLGCPPVGGKGHESPLPAVVFGQLVRLRANDITYEYHIRGWDVRFCGALFN